MHLALLLSVLSLVAANYGTQRSRRGMRQSHVRSVFYTLRAQNIPTNSVGLSGALYEDMRDATYLYPSKVFYKDFVRCYREPELMAATLNFSKKAQRVVWILGEYYNKEDMLVKLEGSLGYKNPLKAVLNSAEKRQQVLVLHLDDYADMYCRYAVLTDGHGVTNPFQKWLGDATLVYVAIFAAQRNELVSYTGKPLFQLTKDQFEQWLKTAESYFTHTTLLIARWHAHDPEYARLVESRIDSLPIVSGFHHIGQRLRMLLVHTLVVPANLPEPEKAAMHKVLVELLDLVLHGLRACATFAINDGEAQMNERHVNMVKESSMRDTESALQVLDQVIDMDDGTNAYELQGILNLFKSPFQIPA